ncbi:Putative cytochrome c oxidase, subunit COX19 [Phaffia rhodozyma]|uniref:Putative cytochrome c oxidase, subunit COX19 n=1 Tax=Phaffia rhodozyma TaxID=264483 RepID=A0A0F7SNE6_PHARH|nr:Putative cytochrome c oxidase, subunit COX19 [Phaffia rhodozyma]
MYLACLKQNQMKNEKCRVLSKQYLQCRFDHGLMEKQDWPSLGFPEDPTTMTRSPTSTAQHIDPSSSSTSSSTPTNSLPTPARGTSGSPLEFSSPPIPDSLRGPGELLDAGMGTGAGPVGVLGGQHGAGGQ